MFPATTATTNTVAGVASMALRQGGALAAQDEPSFQWQDNGSTEWMGEPVAASSEATT